MKGVERAGAPRGESGSYIRLLFQILGNGLDSADTVYSLLVVERNITEADVVQHNIVSLEGRLSEFWLYNRH